MRSRVVMASEVKFLLYGATGYIGTHIKDALTKSGVSTVIGSCRFSILC